MRVYINGIDCGDGKVRKKPTLGIVEVLYYEAKFPTYYPADGCVFTTRFGKRCMVYGEDYSEEDITTITKQYGEWQEKTNHTGTLQEYQALSDSNGK